MRHLALWIVLTGVGCTASNLDMADAGDVDMRTVVPDQNRKPPSGGLVGYWSFDGSGGVQDESGNGNAGTVRGALQIPGKLGLAYAFNGTSCITVPDSPSLTMANGTALSMMAWVEISSGMTCPQDRLDAGYTNWGVILSKNGEYEHGVYCGAGPIYQESISTNAEGGAWVWNGAQPILLGNWHQVVTTWDGSMARHYRDGIQVETRAVAGKLTLSMGATGLGIGCGGVQANGTPNISYGFVGTIDEVALYNRALSASEIASYYAATR